MKKLEQTWRWYGPEDPVTLQDIKQAGATGIVTALHHIPHGEAWPLSEIAMRKKLLEYFGFNWSVVESIPVHEEIKTRGPKADEYIANYKETLRNLASYGIKTITYNFMPVLDWTRTQLDLEMEDGSKGLYFNWVDVAIFDIHVLKRENAAQDYSNEVLDKIDEKLKSYTEKDFKQLEANILMGIPGEGEISLESLRESINVYSKIGYSTLRENLVYFLSQIEDVCEENDIKMTIHPDDPPYTILGLPRIASTLSDLEYIISAIDKPFNGICFCTGSLGAGPENNINEMFESVKHRVNFLHLRNVTKDDIGSFYEANHLEGDVDMYQIMKLITIENQQRETPIPFRPDHGHQMLDDLSKTTNPGYSAIGRLRGLAELRGLELGIISQ